MKRLTKAQLYLISGGGQSSSLNSEEEPPYELPDMEIIGEQPEPPEPYIPEEGPDDGNYGGGGGDDEREHPTCRNPERSIDRSFLAYSEGGQQLESYWPETAKSGKTIGKGVDLGQLSRSQAEALGWPESLISLVEPYFGVIGPAAGDLPNITITEDVANFMNESIYEAIMGGMISRFNSQSSVGPFESLPPGTQTAIADVAYQYGENLAVRTPIFWGQITQGEWTAALANLKDFGDDHQPRRDREALLLESDMEQYRLPTPNAPCG